MKDEYGELPLHDAAYDQASLAVVTFLWRQYPEAVTVKGWRGSLPKDLYRIHGGSDAVIQSIFDGTFNKAEKQSVYALLLVWERVYTLPAEIREAKRAAIAADERIQLIANDVGAGGGYIKHTLGPITRKLMRKKALAAAQREAEDKFTAYTAVQSQQSEGNKALAVLPLDVIRHHIAEFIMN